jgi:cytochrome P450
MRKLVNKVFTPRAVAALEPMIRETITDVAATLDPNSFDVVARNCSATRPPPSSSFATPHVT